MSSLDFGVIGVNLIAFIFLLKAAFKSVSGFRFRGFQTFGLTSFPANCLMSGFSVVSSLAWEPHNAGHNFLVLVEIDTL